MEGNPSSPPLYIGTVAIARPGDPAPPGAEMRADRAAALADAWEQARVTGHVPRVYQVSDGIIGAAVLSSGALAWSALAARRSDASTAEPKARPC